MRIYTVSSSEDGLVFATAKKGKVIQKCIDYLTVHEDDFYLLQNLVRRKLLLARQKGCMLVFVEYEGTEVCIEIFEE
jgi:hypothetical protein